MKTACLETVLLSSGENFSGVAGTVLFRRGQKAFGMFYVISGCVTLDFGVESMKSQPCLSGALVGLPATITKRDYTMTATVTNDARLSFWTIEALEQLLHENPDYCHSLLIKLGERVSETQKLQGALLGGSELPVIGSNVA